jgi:hypothetical protein
MKTTIVSIIIIALVVLGGYALVTSRGDRVATEGDMPGTSDLFRAEDNAIVVTEQRPGAMVTAAVVYLAAPGFVVIHEDEDGEAGTILGASPVLTAGESTGVEIVLARASVDGERLHAMLHSDIDGNGSFDSAVDLPVESKLGGPISGWFDISSDAATSTPVVL